MVNFNDEVMHHTAPQQRKRGVGKSGVPAIGVVGIAVLVRNSGTVLESVVQVLVLKYRYGQWYW